MTISYSSISGGTPFGNTADRPANPAIGQTYSNGELGYQEIYTNGGWIQATGGSDFNLNIAGTYSSTSFSQSYADGSYAISSILSDTTLDIYAFADDGSLAGYTNTKAFTATKRFNKMVVIGGTTSDVLSFEYKKTFATSTTNSETTAGPYITSISTSSLPNLNNTTVITGGNFASDVVVQFTGTDNIVRNAENIVRSSSSSLVVTRPDDFPPSASPYTVTITNPGVISPSGSGANVSSNAVTAGNAPVWVTGSTLPTHLRGIAYSTTIQATDADGGSSISYSIVSNSLTSGLSFNTSTGVISGTPTVIANGSITIRATDSGGNYVDRTFTTNNASPEAPVWITGESLGTINQSTNPSSFTLSASDDGGSVSYTIDTNIDGAYLSGNTLIIPSTASGTKAYVVNAIDENGTSTSRTFTVTINAIGATLYQTPGTYSWVAPSGATSVCVVAVGGGASGRQVDAGDGGGGGGLGWKNNIAVTPGASYTVVVGAGGSDTVTFNSVAGGESYFINTSTVRGGGGAAGVQTATGTGGLGANGGTHTGDGGGNGGRGRRGYSTTHAGGGGGAGGYAGAGGNAGSYVKTGTGNDPKTGLTFDIIEPTVAAAGSGGGGGGGGGSASTARGGGGGVGLYGQGTNGLAGAINNDTTNNGGSGGFGGGSVFSGVIGQGGKFGGGGSGSDAAGVAGYCKGGSGGVRIVWGPGRSFPLTNVGQNYNGIAETVI